MFVPHSHSCELESVGMDSGQVRHDTLFVCEHESGKKPPSLDAEV